MRNFDVAVVGGGPGGYVAAVRCSQLGQSVALIEKESLGGTCVNWGCIPTKSLLKNAEVIHMLNYGKPFGFSCDNRAGNYEVAHSRSRQIAKRQSKRIELLLKSHNIQIIQGQASFSDTNILQIQPSGEQVVANNIILATGSKARNIPGIAFDGDRIVSARDALQLNHAPGSVIIVGAGPIGMEFASLWSRFGSTVTVIEMMLHVLPMEDVDISIEAGVFFRNTDIAIKTATSVSAVQVKENEVEVKVSCNGQEEVLHAEKILIATGFAPNTAELALDVPGVNLTRDTIVVDDKMRTNVPGIYAIGDITGKLGLAHVASAQGLIAAETIAGQSTQALNYNNIPRCTFSAIEVASAGLSQVAAEKNFPGILVQKSPFAPNGKALAINENIGFVKIIADADSRKLLGIHMIGPHVTELISGPAAFLSLGLTIDQLRHLVYPHPTLSEAFLEGVHAISGHGVHL